MFNIFRVLLRKNSNNKGIRSKKTFLTFDDLPHPKALPIIGTKLDLIAAGSGAKLHEYINRRHKMLGPIFREKLSNSEIVFISDPQLIKEVFIKLEGKYPEHILPEPWILYEKLYGSKRGLFFMHGEEWYNNRKIMNKLILKENAEPWLKTSIAEVINGFIKSWIERAEGQYITPELESEFYKLSVDVIIGVLLGSKSSITRSHHFKELLTLFSSTVKKIFVNTTKLYALPLPLCQRLNLKVWADFKESVDISVILAQKLVKEIIAANHPGNGLIYKLQAESIKEEDITRIVADFVIAAGDTTSYTLIWTLYLLSKNRHVLEELQSTMTTNNENLLKHVLKESMRLYPVAPFLTRILPQDYSLGLYHVPKSIPVVASIYTSGRDEEYFSRSSEFIPNRWNRCTKTDLENHEPSASLPFALGARSCVGKKIAIVQLTEFIKQITENFDFECTNEDEVQAVTSQVLIPEKPINLVFKIKKHS